MVNESSNSKKESPKDVIYDKHVNHGNSNNKLGDVYLIYVSQVKI